MDFKWLKVPGFIKVIPHTLKKTGRYCDGRFDPNHLDFETFCGISNTRKTALPLAIAMFIYLIVMSIVFGLLHIQAITSANLAFAPLTILLIFGIWKEKPYLMLPFIILTFISIIGTFISIPLLIAAVFDPESSLFHLFEKNMMTDGTVNSQLTILLMIVINTMSCTVGGFITWSMYVHFCYIRGCRQMIEEQLKAKQMIWMTSDKLDDFTSPKSIA